VGQALRSRQQFHFGDETMCDRLIREEGVETEWQRMELPTPTKEVLQETGTRRVLLKLDSGYLIYHHRDRDSRLFLAVFSERYTNSIGKPRDMGRQSYGPYRGH